MGRESIFLSSLVAKVSRIVFFWLQAVVEIPVLTNFSISDMVLSPLLEVITWYPRLSHSVGFLQELGKQVVQLSVMLYF